MNHTRTAAPIDINALHAGSIRAMSAYVREPSAPLAETVVRLLDALAQHPQRFVAPCGYDVYREARRMWLEIVQRLGATDPAAETAATVTVLH